MSIHARLIWMSLPLMAAAAPARADPAIDPAWRVDLGVISRTRPVHLGAARYTTDLLPIIEAHEGDWLDISLDDGVTAALWRSGRWSAGPVVQYRQSYNDRRPRGAYRMSDAIEVGGFAKARTPIGEVDLRLRKAVDGYGGWSGDLAFDTGGQVSPHWKLGAEARLSWADSAFSREYFGLRRRAVTGMTLPRFGENDFYGAGLELDAARGLGPRSAVVFTLSEDRILGEEWESPLLRSRDVLTAGIGFTYHLGARDPDPGR